MLAQQQEDDGEGAEEEGDGIGVGQRADRQEQQAHDALHGARVATDGAHLEVEVVSVQADPGRGDEVAEVDALRQHVDEQVREPRCHVYAGEADGAGDGGVEDVARRAPEHVGVGGAPAVQGVLAAHAHRRHHQPEAEHAEQDEHDDEDAGDEQQREAGEEEQEPTDAAASGIDGRDDAAQEVQEDQRHQEQQRPDGRQPVGVALGDDHMAGVAQRGQVVTGVFQRRQTADHAARAAPDPEQCDVGADGEDEVDEPGDELPGRGGVEGVQQRQEGAAD